MKLLDIVVKDAIIPTLIATGRDAAITEIIDTLVTTGALSPELRDEFVKAIIKREKRGSTGFGHGVAVPHVKHSAINKMAIAIGISPTGVEFNALDQQPVYSIFLLLSPEISLRIIWTRWKRSSGISAKRRFAGFSAKPRPPPRS